MHVIKNKHITAKFNHIRYIAFTMYLIILLLEAGMTQNQNIYQILKYHVVSHNKKLNNKNDGNQLFMTEMFTIIDRYVLYDNNNMFFYIDSVQDSFLRLIYSTDTKPYEISLKKYLLGNNKVQFYGFDIQKQILFDLNNNIYIKYELQREDTIISWKNKTHGSFFDGQCKIEVSKDKSLHFPPISFIIKNIHPIKIESPKIIVRFEKKHKINWIPFRKEFDLIREKLNQVNENTSIKKIQFKDYFIPTLDELIIKDKKSK